MMNFHPPLHPLPSREGRFNVGMTLLIFPLPLEGGGQGEGEKKKFF
jgi:hypothetical protein